MYHPLNAIQKKLPAFLWLLGATIAISVVFRFIGPYSPNIVDYEFVWNTARANAVINAWDATARLRAAFNLGFDYLYMPAYSTTIALACAWGAGLVNCRFWNGAGILLAWGLWLAAILDAIENVALYTMLLGTVTDPYPLIAGACATGKFGIIILGLLYSAIALVVYLITRKRKKALSCSR
jgi:hypothetical protein